LEGIAVTWLRMTMHLRLPLPCLTSGGQFEQGLGMVAVVQYCKNCLLVHIRCLFPPIFAWGSQPQDYITQGGDFT
jgi:hypothetical protein